MANDEFAGREQQIPNQMGALIHGHIKEVTSAEHQTRLDYAEFMKMVCAADSVMWAVQVGILTLDQALTVMAQIPLINYVNTDYLGVTDSTLEMEFRVSASRQDTSKTDTHVDTETNISAGGGGLSKLFGAPKVSTKISAGMNYSKENQRKSDYSSRVSCTVNIGRLPPPEGVAFMQQVTQDVVNAAMDINKQLIQKQANQLSDDMEAGDVPKQLPGSDSDTADGSSGDSAGGGAE